MTERLQDRLFAALPVMGADEIVADMHNAIISSLAERTLQPGERLTAENDRELRREHDAICAQGRVCLQLAELAA